MHVLTIADREADTAHLVCLGYRIAQALGRSLTVLCLDGRASADAPPSFPLAVSPPDGTNSPIASTACSALTPLLAPASADTAEAERGAAAPALLVPAVELRVLEREASAGIVLDHIAEIGADYLIVAKRAGKKAAERLAHRLFMTSPTHTLLVRPGTADPGPPRRILVPTAGGPHAAIALRLAEGLARAGGGTATAMLVNSTGGELPEAVGERRLARAIRRSELPAGSQLTSRVVLARSPAEGLEAVAGEGYDLVLLGASGAGKLRAQLFGNLTDRLIGAAEGTTVAVVRRQWSWADRTKARVGRWLDVTVPQLRREDRVKLYETLESGSTWNFDFMALISLSTAIAALGLLQNSGAVVIGAMLVAPLMTPILGAGLALVQGNALLLRNAARSIFLGYLMALLIGLVAGWSFPAPALTAELLARGGPTLLDLGVALLSGLAAAYCLGRPGLVAALPGVAIAAALVPPIATTGISLALGAHANAAGSALLFFTNVIAIILGAALALWGAGVRGAIASGGRKGWVRTAFLTLLLVATALAVQLASVTTRGRPVTEDLRQRVAADLATETDAHLLSVREVVDDGHRIIEVVVQAPRPLGRSRVDELVAVIRADRGAGQTVRVRTELAHEVR